MSNNQSLNTDRTIFIKLALIGFGSIVIGVAVYLLIVAFFPAYSLKVTGELDWGLLEGFASLISLAVLVGGVSFVVTEYISAEHAKRAEKNKLSYDIYKDIFEKLTHPEQEAARRWILLNIDIKKDEEDIAAWYKRTHIKISKTPRGNKDSLPEGQSAVKITLNCFDYIGFVADHYWELEDDSLDWISAPIAKVWRRIGPYVTHIRELRNTTDYYVSAEYIGRLCIERRKSKGLPDETIAKETP